MIFGRNKKNRGDVENKNAFVRKIIRKISKKKNDLNNSNKTSSSPASSSPALSLQQDQEQPLSKLSTTMTQFVVETARKTHDSLQDEEERSEFLLMLRDEMRSEVFAPLGNYQHKKGSFTIPIAYHENDKNNDHTTNKNEIREIREQQDADEYKEESSSLSSLSSVSSTSSITSTVSNNNLSLNTNPENKNNNSNRRRNSMNVIDFLVKTSQGTLESIPQEEDQNIFKNYLRRSFRKEFIPSSQ